jgi:hypothetical protein
LQNNRNEERRPAPHAWNDQFGDEIMMEFIKRIHYIIIGKEMKKKLRDYSLEEWKK